MTEDARRFALRAAAKVALMLPVGCGANEAPVPAPDAARACAVPAVADAPREIGDAGEDAAYDADPAAVAAFGCCVGLLEGALPDASFATYFEKAGDPSVVACCRFAIAHLEAEHEADPTQYAADRGALDKRGAHFACCSSLGFPEGAACSSWGPPAPPPLAGEASSSWLPALDLRRESLSIALALVPSGPFGTAARATWATRMAEEHASARVFEALAAELRRAGLAADADTCLGFAAEERRHGVLCGAVVEALGGEAKAGARARAEVPAHDDVSVTESLLRSFTSVACLSETIAVALIGAEWTDMPPGPLRDLLTVIFADEVGHARFGWRLLAELVPSLDGAARARLVEYVGVAVAHARAHFAAHIPEVSYPRAARALGLCDGRAARRLVDETIDQVILPRLADLGLAA